MTTATSPTASGLVQNAEYTDQPVEMTGLWPIVLKLPEEVVANGHDACANWFWELCIANDESAWQIELNASGELEIMPPTDEPADRYENRMSSKVYIWDEEAGNPGDPTGPTAAYRLPNGALRVPDTAWSPWENVRQKQAGDPRGRPYCPDFVVEIRSASQRSLRPLLNKMQEYMDNGTKLGWLIDPHRARRPHLPRRRR